MRYSGRHTQFDYARDRLDRKLGDTGREAIRRNAEAKAVYDVAVREVQTLLPFPYWHFIDQYAEIDDLLAWADSIMQREPDFVIGGDYMLRWFILPRNERMNIYLHNLLRSDEDVMHDHPWDSTSFVLKGGFWEETPEGRFWRAPGDVIHRKAADAHRLELPEGQTSVSLFFTGPKVRDWGFHCPKGWVPWQTFTGGYHDGRSDKGAGCGEYA